VLVFLPKKGSGRSATERLRSAIGIAEVDAGLVAPGFGQFAFLFLVFGEFLVGVGKGVARSEHGVGLGGQLLLLAQGAEFVADLTDRALRSLSLPRADHSLFQENHEGGKDGEREEGARLPDEQ